MADLGGILDTNIPFKANTLADYQGQNQTYQQNQNVLAQQSMALKAAQAQQRDQQFVRSILSDPSNKDPKTGLISDDAIGKVAAYNPDLAIKFSNVRSQQLERKAQAAHLDSETADINSKRTLGVLTAGASVLDDPEIPPDKRAEKARNAMLEAIDLESVGPDEKDQARARVAQMTPEQIRTGVSILKARAAPKKSGDVETITDAKGNTFDHDKLTGENTFVSGPDGEAGKSYTPQGGVERIAGAVDPAAMGLRERAEGEREREDSLRNTQAQERISIAREAANAKPNLTEAAIDGVADQVLAGDPSGLTNLGRGKQGAADVAAVRNRVWEKADAAGISGTDLANIDAEFHGQKAGESYLGRRGAQLSQAGAALDLLIGQSKEVYSTLPRGEFLPFNRLQKVVATETASPEQAAAFAADTAVINQWAKAINPTGQLTVEASRRGAEMLSNVTSHEAHDRVLDQMRKEIGAERASLPSARSDVRRNPGGKEEKSPSTPPASMIPEGHAMKFKAKDGSVHTFQNVGGKVTEVE